MSEARQGPFDHEKTWREDQRFAINIDIFKPIKNNK
jgi:hypothetical protein